MKKDKFYDVWTITIFMLCFGIAFMTLFACESVATVKEIRVICNFGVMVLLCITIFNLSKKYISIKLHRNYTKAMVINTSLFIFCYIITYIKFLICNYAVIKIIVWIVLATTLSSFIYTTLLVLMSVDYKFKDQNEELLNIDKNELKNINKINYNELIIKLMSNKIWTGGINTKIIFGDIGINVTSYIIIEIEKIIKRECPKKDDKNMLITILDGCNNNSNNISNTIFVVFATMAMSLTT